MARGKTLEFAFRPAIYKSNTYTTHTPYNDIYKTQRLETITHMHNTNTKRKKKIKKITTTQRIKAETNMLTRKNEILSVFFATCAMAT